MKTVDEALLAAMPLPPAQSDSDKEDRGRVLVVGGSAEVPGAVRLAGEAALRAGAGKLQMAVPGVMAVQLGLLVPESRVVPIEEAEPFAAKADAVAVGPGMLDKAHAEALTHRLLEAAERPAFAIDAAAMRGAWSRPELVRTRRVVLTPHAGEMASLTGVSKEAVLADPASAARDAAAHLGATIALKGADTVIASPDGETWIHHGHTPGLATSGSGDVLAGLVAGLLARGAPPVVAALWAVWLHNQAGERLSQNRPLGFLARELPAQALPPA